MFFVDNSSAFNTTIPAILISILSYLGLPTHTCSRIKDFWTNHTQTVRLGSSTITLSTGSPQGCVSSPTLYSLCVYDCIPAHPTNDIIKFADDTIVVGLISGGGKLSSFQPWASVNKRNTIAFIHFNRRSYPRSKLFYPDITSMLLQCYCCCAEPDSTLMFCSLFKWEHFLPYLASLHWLPVWFVYKSPNGLPPSGPEN